MAYDSKGLTQLASAGSWGLWHYRTDDALSDVVLLGYFPWEGGFLHHADLMHITAKSENGLRMVTSTFQVRVHDSGEIDLAPQERLGGS